MCQPCCDNTYQKYITEDGTVAETFLQQNYGDNAKVVAVEDTTSELGKWIYSREQRYPIYHHVEVGTAKRKICMCDCHKVGSNLMH